MSSTTATEQLQRLQAWRGPRDRSVRLSDVVGDMKLKSTRVQHQLGSFIDAWVRLVPEQIARHTLVEAKRGGTVHVKVRSASVSFELDRRLREGLLDELRAACHGSITSVRIRIGRIEVAESATR